MTVMEKENIKENTEGVFCVKPRGAFTSEIEVPGDKSISHRAVMFGAIAEGLTEITNFLEGEDNISTLEAFMKMGVSMERTSKGNLKIQGVGLNGLKEPTDIIDCGNSGTTTRLITGLLAGQSFFSVLTGDSSLKKRPMKRVLTPLKEMGANISGRNNGDNLPIAITGTPLKAIDYNSPVASAQLKSAILLAGLYADGTTSVIEPMKSRDHTENMLKAFGVDVKVDGLKVSVDGKQKLKATKIEVPGDISSAAFFIVAALITEGSELIIKNVGLNETRIGIINVLKKMNANIEIINERNDFEPIGDIKVTSSKLQAIDIDEELLLPAIDEFPIICIAAAFAKGITKITGAKELRVKESDRIMAMAENLSAIGIEVTEQDDGLEIIGNENKELDINKKTTCKCYDDHRIAMAMSVAALKTKDGLSIDDPKCVEISFPGFFEILNG